MADDDFTDGTKPSAKAEASAFLAAFGTASASDEAREYLRKQSRLADLQIDSLGKQDEFEISHLRWRRFNDQMRGALQIMLVAIGLVIVIGIVAVMWNASRADGLIVEAFTAPPDFAARGVSGGTIAGDVTERLATIRERAMNESYSFTSDVSADHANDFKVEIPDTGISLSEAWRYLRSWLGNTHKLTGNLRRLDDGRIELAVSLDGRAPIVHAGRSSELPVLEQQTAEDVFGAFDPVNYINFLTSLQRRKEAMIAAGEFVQHSHGILHGDAYVLWSYTTVYATGDIELGLARAHLAEALYPHLAVAHVMSARFNGYLGRTERQLEEDRVVLQLRNADQPQSHQHGGFDEMKAQAAAQIALLHGDYSHAVGWRCGHSCPLPERLVERAEIAALLHDPDGARALIGQVVAASANPPASITNAYLELDTVRGNWADALARAKLMAANELGLDMSPRFTQRYDAVTASPAIALALEHLGQPAAAQAVITSTPRDCVPCEIVRGKIDALQGDDKGAAFWFAQAGAEAPSQPFADTEWGEMLLHRGQPDAAIAKFSSAHRKGLYFADPLEMWAEALIAKNRSDLAITKFEEAAQDAPNWGRLHLKWGEALWWSGHRAQAKKQFHIAQGLFLDSAEKRQLSTVQGLAKGAQI